MNISSLIVNLKDLSFCTSVKEKILSLDNAEVIDVIDNKLIVVLQSIDLNCEIKSFKFIEKIDGVVCINMVYSAQDLYDDMEKIKYSNSTQIMQKFERLAPKDIKYGGDINNILD